MNTQELFERLDVLFETFKDEHAGKKNPSRCLPRKKAQSMTKAERASTARKKKAAGKKGKQFVSNTKPAKYRKGTYQKKS